MKPDVADCNDSASLIGGAGRFDDGGCVGGAGRVDGAGRIGVAGSIGNDRVLLVSHYKDIEKSLEDKQTKINAAEITEIPKIKGPFSFHPRQPNLTKSQQPTKSQCKIAKKVM